MQAGNAGQGSEFRSILEELTGDNESAGFLEIGNVDEQGNAGQGAGSDAYTPFGVCPECGREGVYLNVHKDQFMVCHEHKVAWAMGHGNFSSWRYETPADWERNRQLLNSYRMLEAGEEWERVQAPADNAGQYAERQARYMAGAETGVEVHSAVTSAGDLRVTVTPLFDGGVHVAITDARGWLLGVQAFADGATYMRRPGYALKETSIEDEESAGLAGLNDALPY